VIYKLTYKFTNFKNVVKLN